MFLMIRNFLLNYLTSNKDIAVVLKLAVCSPSVELAIAQILHLPKRRRTEQLTVHISTLRGSDVGEVPEYLLNNRHALKSESAHHWSAASIAHWWLLSLLCAQEWMRAISRMYVRAGWRVFCMCVYYTPAEEFSPTPFSAPNPIVKWKRILN